MNTRQPYAANEVPPLREFVIRIKRGDVTRLTFTAMAVDALDAAAQHECLCETGEYVVAMPAERYRHTLDNEFCRCVDASEPSAEERERRATHRALEEQQQRLGVAI